jgi:hydroxymethylpyrimidine pyrophosphatase-like HAD family hydrolase
MRPLVEFPAVERRRVVGVFTDIDDTLTTEGRLAADAYAALKRLHGAGLVVVPITGRPAGWCDLIARFWPVDGVVGENGAFYFRHDRKRRKLDKRFLMPEAERAENRRRLAELRDRILHAVPGAALASDQSYRGRSRHRLL